MKLYTPLFVSLLSLISLFGVGCKPDAMELRGRNFGTEEVTEAECDFASNQVSWGVMVSGADRRSHLYGAIPYKGTNCTVQYRRANGQMVKKVFDVRDKIEWLKKNCKGHDGVLVIFKIIPEKETVEIEVSCKN